MKYEAYAVLTLIAIGALFSVAMAGELRRDPRYPKGGWLVFGLILQAWVASVIWRLM